MTKLPTSITSLVDQTRRIPLDQIRDTLVRLRSEASYTNEGLEELGASLEKRQLQTIVVQPAVDAEGEIYDLVIGSRRLRAAKRKGLQDIAAYVIEKQTPVELLFIALAENIHRLDLDPFEEAQGFLKLMKEYDVPLKDVAIGIQKSQEYVRVRLQVLSMPEEVVALVSEKKLGVNHTSVLARLHSGDDQTRIAQLAVRNKLTEPELRLLVRKELREPMKADRLSNELTAVKVDARLQQITEWLQKVPRRLKLRRLNATEKNDILKGLQALEDEVRSLRATMSGLVPTSDARHANLTRSHEAKSNHGEEWTVKDIRRINSVRRPDDETLGAELGREPSAIRAMRAKTSDKVK